ncbi:MAG: hypothetical protein ACLP7Q_07415 [Isosphaeraceae bacterium]
MNDEATTMGRLISGFILGVIASVVLGGFVGLIFWALDTASLPDWLLAGTLFGLVVGGVGAITGTVARGLAPNLESRFVGILLATAALFGAVPGVLLGLGFNRGITEPIIYGACGAIGATVAAFVVWRTTGSGERAPPPQSLN